MIATLIAFAALLPIKVACVGDSITWGAGTKDPATQSYPAQLQSLLGSGYHVGNFGKPWAALTKTADVPYWTLPEFRSAKEFLPQIVLIMLGTNDARTDNWAKGANLFVPQYKELIRVFRDLPSHPKVFLCLPPPSDAERDQNVSTRIIPLTEQVGREAEAPVIDTHTLFEGHPELLEDNLHPREAGAELMAETVAEAIENPANRKKAWRVVSVDSEEREEGPAADAVDGDPNTFWHTNYSSKETRPPHEIVVDMGQSVKATAFRYLPRQDGGVNGRVKSFELYLSEDGKTWGSPALSGEIANSAKWTSLNLPAPVTARFFKFRALSEWSNGPWTSAAELDIRQALRH